MIIIIIGRIKAISTSKIKKIIVIKKNRRENGKREDLLGSNPHSKGEHFSRSVIDFFDNKEAKNIIIIVNKIINKLINKVIKIIYTKLNLVLMIGSHIYYYTIQITSNILQILSTSSVNWDI